MQNAYFPATTIRARRPIGCGPAALVRTRGRMRTTTPHQRVIMVDRDAFPPGVAHPTARGAHPAGRRHQRRCRAVATAQGPDPVGDARAGARAAPPSGAGTRPSVARSGTGGCRAKPASDALRGAPNPRRPRDRRRRAPRDPERTGGAGRRRPGGGRCAGVRGVGGPGAEDRRRGQPAGGGRPVQRRSAPRPAGCRLADRATRRGSADPSRDPGDPGVQRAPARSGGGPGPPEPGARIRPAARGSRPHLDGGARRPGPAIRGTGPL